MAITDKLTRATDSATGRPIIATLSGSKAIGAASVTLSVATNWTTTTPVYVAIYTVTAAGIKDPTSQTDWKAQLSGTTLSSMTPTGGTDRTYSAGAIVEITFTAAWAKDMYDWMAAHGNVDGSLKATAVQTAIGAMAVGSISTTKLSNPYKFRVYRSAAYNTAASTLTAFPFDTKTSTQGFDTGTNIDVVTNKGRFTAPIAGFYFFTGRFSVTTTRAFATLSVNGTEANRGHDMTVASGEVSGVVQGLLQLAANDYVEMYYFTASATAISTGSALAYFSGHLVSAT